MPMRYVTVTAIALSLLVILGATQFRSSGKNSQLLPAQTVNSLPTAEPEHNAAFMWESGTDRPTATAQPLSASSTSIDPTETKIPLWTEDHEQENDSNQSRIQNNDGHQEHDEDDD